MGCGGSTFTEDETVFLKKSFARDPQYLDNSIVDGNDFTRISMCRDLFMAHEDYVVKKSDGSDFLKVLNEKGKKQVCNMDGKMVAALIFSVRYSEVNAVDAAFNLPHIYIYSRMPFKEGQQPPSDVGDDGGHFFMWARVHKVANIGTPKFEVCMAEFEGSAEGANLEKFGYTAYMSTVFKTGLEIKKGAKGCCHCSHTEDAESPFKITIAPNIDPALMISIIMAIESLKQR